MGPRSAADPPPAIPAHAAVEARDLSFRYPSGRLALDEVSFTVAPGERVVLMGPNGAGKSSLLRLVAGELRPSRGRLSVLGRAAVSAEPAARRRVSVAGDRPVHLDVLGGRSNALVFARAARLDHATAANRVDALLERFELASVADLPVAAYSHGMRRKLLLVEALAPRSELVVLDEPTLGLDPAGIDALAALVGAVRERGSSALIATNDLGAAPRLADRIVFLDEGRVAADAPLGELLALVEHDATTVEVVEAPPATDDGRGTRTRREVADGVRDRLGGLEADPTPQGLVVRLPSPDGVPRLVEALVEAGVKIRRLDIREPNLGDVFRTLTGRELAEPGAEP